MDQASAGDLVNVDSGGPVLDGIVFEVPSATKVVVAVVDRSRGPVFRTVHPSTLSEREGEGSDDRALQALIRRTPPPKHGRGGAGAGVGAAPEHRRAAMHRTTGK